MHRNLPRPVMFGFLLALLIPLLPVQAEAQHQQGCGGGNAPPPVPTVPHKPTKRIPIKLLAVGRR